MFVRISYDSHRIHYIRLTNLKISICLHFLQLENLLPFVRTMNGTNDRYNVATLLANTVNPKRKTNCWNFDKQIKCENVEKFCIVPMLIRIMPVDLNVLWGTLFFAFRSNGKTLLWHYNAWNCSVNFHLIMRVSR